MSGSASSSRSIAMSISLCGPASPRATEPNSAAWRTPRRCNSSSCSLSVAMMVWRSMLPIYRRSLVAASAILGRQQLLPVDALLLRRARIELAVAFREVRGRDETAGDRHFDHRHRRLDEQMAGAVEPDLQVIARRRAAH